MIKSWSFSAYSMAAQCLRKYQYCFIDKIVPEGPESGDLLFGSALHSAINACLTGQDGIQTFQIYWSSYQDKDVEYGRYKWAELASLGDSFMRKFAKFHAPKYKLEFAEKRLYGEWGGVKIEGTLDFYGKYSGRLALRDFKTAGRNYEPSKADCATQLYLYTQLAIQNGMKAPETLGYTVFNKGTGSIQDLTWEFSEKAMKEALDDLVGYTWIWGSVVLEYPRNLNSCHDYNRPCQYFNRCHLKGET